MWARNITAVLLLSSAMLMGACDASQAAVVDDARLIAAPSSEQWLTIGRDYAETRFSPLTEINSRNVGQLGLACRMTRNRCGASRRHPWSRME